MARSTSPTQWHRSMLNKNTKDSVLMIHQVSIVHASLRTISVSLFLSAFILISGCDVSKNPPAAVVTSASVNAPPPTAEKHSGRRLDLTIAGYNYTNRYIDDFTVNGQWGGNLSISEAGSAGGGSACCVAYLDTAGKDTVKVRWQSGACYFTTKSTISNDTYQNLHSFYKEVEVELDKSSARKPNYLEIHFYPDGTVKAAVTDKTSPPVMIVDPASEDRSRFPRCPDDKKPL
jgi:hypothetical protein